MITPFTKRDETRRDGPVTKLVILLGSEFCGKMMSSILALLSVRGQWDMKVEVPRKHHLEFMSTEWE